MAQALPDKARQEKMMLQFRRIDKFLQANSKRFYQEYDTYNTILTRLREQLEKSENELRQMTQSKTSSASDLNFVAQIDAEDGVSNRLNMQTLALVRLANGRLFNFLIKQQLNVQDLQNISFRQIPREADAILFITNPLLVFELINDFLKYRKNKPSFIYIYITNRVARWLFRFTQFVMVYDQFHKIVKLTLLQPARFSPFKSALMLSVRTLCREARDSVLDQEKPVFLNDLRRLYIILARALLMYTMDGQHPPSEIKTILSELTPVISLGLDELREDGIQAEFQLYHFTSPDVLDSFFEEFSILQQRDVEYTYEFLGFLHPTDLHMLLVEFYNQSKSYVIQLFLKIREYYEYHGQDLPAHYNTIANAIRKIVDYQEVMGDSTVSDELKQQAFWEESLYLAKPSSKQMFQSTLSGEGVELATLSGSGEATFVTREQIFEAFYHDPVQAKAKNLLMELASIPFCYLTIEYGKPRFNLFTFGDTWLMELPRSAYGDLLQYLYNTGQLDNMEVGVLKRQMKEIAQLMKSLVKKLKINLEKAPIYDHRQLLTFYQFEQAVYNITDFFQHHWPDFLNRRHQQQFILELLWETERWISRTENAAIHELDPQWVIQFISSDEFEPLLTSLKETTVGRTYHDDLREAMVQGESFKQRLIQNYRIRRKLLEYERVRFEDQKPTSSKETADPLDSSQNQDTIDPILLPSRTKTQIFEDLTSNPTDKQPYFLELGRMPFRFLEMEFGKPQFMIFTLADTVAMEMNGEVRKALLDFLFVTRQLDETQLKWLKRNLVGCLIFLNQMCQNINWGKTQCGLTTDVLNFEALRRQLALTDKAILKTLKPLAVFKIQMQIMLDALSELQRWTARLQNRPYADLEPEELLKVIEQPELYFNALTQIKATPFGRQHLETFSNTSQAKEALRQQMYAELQLNIRLKKYYQQYLA